MKSCTALTLLLTIFLATAPANACLNDRDTLAEEIKGLPEVTQIITGRFERNPPLYYKMRIKRLQSEIPAHPDVLNNYDDIAVALDRVHRDDEAIRWEERKRGKLVALKVSATDPATKENWYRYYANCGTCWVHRWLGRGADRKRIAEVKTARNMIAKAIAIKPGAHEGREKYQLLAMDWIIKAPMKLDYPGAPASSKPTLRNVSLGEFILDEQRNYDGAIRGLSGLVVLGSAWESIDIFSALSSSFDMEHGRMEDFAYMRCVELRLKGARSLMDSRQTPEPTAADPWKPFDKDAVNTYKYLRAEADAWQVRRTTYMTTRLQAGRHPDTDPSFWSDWHDSGSPDPPLTITEWLWNRLGKPMPFDRFQSKLDQNWQDIAWTASTVVVLVVAFGIFRKLRKRELKAQATSRQAHTASVNSKDSE
ncbi:MAG TPA: hypothetical protein VGK19_12640 [Capsulimonadaceae bacterium]|jgi:hypothetical protein